MDLEELTAATFQPHVGEPFCVEAAGARFDLVLESVTSLGDRPGGRDPFSLLFGGPPDPPLPQAIHRLQHAGLGVLEIFIVPIARTADAARYEAIFT